MEKQKIMGNLITMALIFDIGDYRRERIRDRHYGIENGENYVAIVEADDYIRYYNANSCYRRTILNVLKRKLKKKKKAICGRVKRYNNHSSEHLRNFATTPVCKNNDRV